MENQNSSTGNAEVKKAIVTGAVPAMIWGIISIVTCMYFGWIGSIVSFSKRKKALQLYEANPSNYDEKSLNFLKSAKICATIGLWVSIFATFFFIVYIVFIVFMISGSYYY